MRLLLDAHLTPNLARHLSEGGIDAVAIKDWLDRGYRSASDELILSAAFTDERVLVTYDCRTIPSILKEWAESDRHHAGVILVDEKTLQPVDLGGLVRAIRALVSQCGADSWQDRVIFLRAAGRQ